MYSFGGAAGNPFARAHVARQGGGGGARGQQQAQAANPMMQLVQLLPLLMLLLFTFLSSRSQPAYSLSATREYGQQFATATHAVPFWVRNAQQLHRDYPPGSRER